MGASTLSSPSVPGATWGAIDGAIDRGDSSEALKKTIRIAVLGAGIMGSSLALFLARRGVQVTLIDKAAQPLTAASRWNEGKIHLGYLYSADQSLRTADALLPGGLSLKRLTEELIGCSLERATTQEDDLYLVHRESVVTPDVVGRYFEEVSTRARSHPDGSDYFVNLTEAKIRALSSRQLETLADTRRVVAGFRVPERSVSTNWIADRYVEALAAEPGIQLVLNTRVIAARPVEDSLDGCWHLA
jgi:glycine/D-amino acid oxidase-like deaminating enzyme